MDKTRDFYGRRNTRSYRLIGREVEVDVTVIT